MTAGLLPGPLEFLGGYQLCDCAHIQHEVQGLVVALTEGGVLVFLRPYPQVLCSTGLDTWAQPPASNGGLASDLGLDGACVRRTSGQGPCSRGDSMVLQDLHQPLSSGLLLKVPN